jgi:UDP:flavonoid glycosyltransferase YjiC (YdhE family)
MVELRLTAGAGVGGRTMRVLVSSTGGVGHLIPLLPVARALDRAGHAVRIACPESFTGFAGRYGLPVSGFGEPDPDEFAAVWATVSFDDSEEANRVVVGQVYGRLDATAALPGLDALVGQWRPDLVLRDTAEFGAALVAERYRLPCVRVGCSLAVMDAVFAPAAAHGLAALRAAEGLPSDPEGRTLLAGIYLTQFPHSFEDPTCPADGAWRFREVAPAREPLPDWWAGGDDPLVYVSFGTVAASQGLFPSLYAAVVDSLAELPVRVLATVGEAADPAALGSLPPGVHVERFVPQDQVLSVATVMVTHGGSGSVLGALAAGLPLVVLPLFADQPRNAARVAALGAGITVAGGPAAAGQIGAAVAAVLDNPAYEVGAQRVADEIEALPTAGQAAGMLAKLVTPLPA